MTSQTALLTASCQGRAPGQSPPLCPRLQPCRRAPQPRPPQHRSLPGLRQQLPLQLPRRPPLQHCQAAVRLGASHPAHVAEAQVQGSRRAPAPQHAPAAPTLLSWHTPWRPSRPRRSLRAASRRRPPPARRPAHTAPQVVQDLLIETVSSVHDSACNYVLLCRDHGRTTRSHAQ